MEEQSLAEFLMPIFSASMSKALNPDPPDVKGFQLFFDRYQKGLAIERAAVENLE